MESVLLPGLTTNKYYSLLVKSMIFCGKEINAYAVRSVNSTLPEKPIRASRRARGSKWWADVQSKQALAACWSEGWRGDCTIASIEGECKDIVAIWVVRQSIDCSVAVVFPTVVGS